MLQLLQHRILSTRRRHKVSGTVSLQIGFVEPRHATSSEDALRHVRMVYGALTDQCNVGRGLVGVLGVPAVGPASFVQSLCSADQNVARRYRDYQDEIQALR